MGKIGYYLLSIFELLTGFEEPLSILRIFLGRKMAKTATLRLRKPPLALEVRGKMDVWSIKETFIDRFYIHYGCEIQDGWTVVDIGAAIGEFSLQAAHDRPNARVIAYEPFPESVEILKRNVTRNNLGNVEVVPKAVWKRSGKLLLDLSENEPLKITSGAGDGHSGNSIEVQAVSLADVLRNNHLAQVDLLKLDCEGTEFDLLLGSDPRTVMQFKRIVMEYHDSGEDRQHGGLEQHLAGLGYRVRSKQNDVHAALGYLYAERL